MLRFATVLSIALLIIALGCSRVASQEDELEPAEALLVAMKLETSLTQTMEIMIDLQLQQLGLPEQLQSVVLDFFEKYMGWEGLKDELAEIYASEFTAAELNEMTSFYETPVGQKVAESLPALAQRTAQLGVDRVQANIGELQRAIEAEAQRLGL